MPPPPPVALHAAPDATRAEQPHRCFINGDRGCRVYGRPWTYARNPRRTRHAPVPPGLLPLRLDRTPPLDRRGPHHHGDAAHRGPHRHVHARPLHGDRQGRTADQRRRRALPARPVALRHGAQRRQGPPSRRPSGRQRRAHARRGPRRVHPRHGGGAEPREHRAHGRLAGTPRPPAGLLRRRHLRLEPRGRLLPAEPALDDRLRPRPRQAHRHATPAPSTRDRTRAYAGAGRTWTWPPSGQVRRTGGPAIPGSPLPSSAPRPATPLWGRRRTGGPPAPCRKEPP